MYTKVSQTVLMCICTSRDVVDLKDLVKKYDSRAFFVVADVNEAMGEGFIENWS